MDLVEILLKESSAAGVNAFVRRTTWGYDGHIDVVLMRDGIQPIGRYPDTDDGLHLGMEVCRAVARALTITAEPGTTP